MSLRRILRRASGILILGISMQFASVLLQGGLSCADGAEGRGRKRSERAGGAEDRGERDQNAAVF